MDGWFTQLPTDGVKELGFPWCIVSLSWLIGQLWGGGGFKVNCTLWFVLVYKSHKTIIIWNNYWHLEQLDQLEQSYTDFVEIVS